MHFFPALNVYDLMKLLLHFASEHILGGEKSSCISAIPMGFENILFSHRRML